MSLVTEIVVNWPILLNKPGSIACTPIGPKPASSHVTPSVEPVSVLKCCILNASGSTIASVVKALPELWSVSSVAEVLGACEAPPTPAGSTGKSKANIPSNAVVTTLVVIVNGSPVRGLISFSNFKFRHFK